MIYRITKLEGTEWIPVDGRGITARMMKNVRHYTDLGTVKSTRTRLANESRRFDVEGDSLLTAGLFRIEQCPEDWTPID